MPKTNRSKKEIIFEKELLPNVDSLHTFAYHLAFNEDDAKDLVQETFMKAFKALDSYEPGTNAKAWLFKILKNAYINQYRKKIRRPITVDYEDYLGYQELEEQGNVDFFDLRVEIFDNLMGDEVTFAVNSLPVDFRAVILLCDIENFTYEEISKIIDVPIGTVRSRLHRARNMLKEKLANYARDMGYQDKRSNTSKEEE
ncbi:sigma-70 family RNA polymerase sigma factor [Membranihabitans marinus]|uniref:sigma-70 family RNA polymerase sigma factor n=1 Tax=Membranihabitans marinus TaxID=1227546 RepID=UPI001F3A87D8|nr:sigma-70 family RNA polymerase sigma factor [Membranihabitans marinus]